MIAIDLIRDKVHDTNVLAHLRQDLYGKLVGDKGYLSQILFEKLLV
jgi:hypothetical protein